MKETIIAIENAPGLERPLIYPGFDSEAQAWQFIKDLRTCPKCASEHEAGAPLENTHCGSHWRITTSSDFNPSEGEYNSYHGPNCPTLNK